MSDKDKPGEQKRNINVNLDAQKTPTLYADGYLIGSNQHVVKFHFTQDSPNPSEKQVVSRVALTTAQAKEFLRSLNDHIEKYEV